MAAHHSVDVVIIGSGAAGLACALRLPSHYRVAVLSKGGVTQSSTYWAQGGMAAVLHARDSVSAHVEDTLAVGAGLCHRDAVEFTVSHSRATVEWLVSLGVDFDLRQDVDPSSTPEYHLAQEGGHSHRRIVHAADRTGGAIGEVLQSRARDAGNIELLPGRIAVDLVVRDGRCRGVYVLDEAREVVDVFQARAVVLASGGASKAYLYTSNPDGASGDGIAMAWRAGCRVATLEFNQFHPTCLYHPQAKSFLVSEALRGEGALLKLPSGERFMSRFDPREELAPRDVVARAIDDDGAWASIACSWTSATGIVPSSSSTFPPLRPAAWNWASTLPASRYPWFPRRITPAGASLSTTTAEAISRGSTPSAQLAAGMPGLRAVSGCPHHR